MDTFEIWATYNNVSSHAALPVVLEQRSPEAGAPAGHTLDVVTEGQLGPQPGHPIAMVSSQHQRARGPGAHHGVVSWEIQSGYSLY